MITAAAEYEAYEALAIGTRPVVRISFLPYTWSNGVDSGGDFDNCYFVSPDRIQAYYRGFDEGSWISDVIEVELEVENSPATLIFVHNSPGFDFQFYYRGAESETSLAAAAWIEISSGDSMLVWPYYQFKMELVGYRAWAVDEKGSGDSEESWYHHPYSGDSGDPGDFTAWAIDEEDDSGLSGDSWEEILASYAAPTEVEDDPLTYVEALIVLGEYTMMGDIEEAGSLVQEIPSSFDDLVSGEHSGLLLNNRQGSFVAGSWVPAPRYSPDKSSFFMGDQDWYGLQMRVDFGWAKGGWFAGGFGEDEWLAESYTDFITLFLGKVQQWGPVSRAIDADGMLSPHTVEVYAVDWIMDCLQKRIALPASDGTPNPLTFGEFLCKTKPISGWSPLPPLKTAGFEANNFDELDGVVQLGGGAVEIITPGLVDNYAFRATTTGANQSAYGAIHIPVAGEMFVTGMMRFHSIPTSITTYNFVPMAVYTAAGVLNWAISIYSNGLIAMPVGMEAASYNILSQEDIPIPFSFWIKNGSEGHWKLWINGDEVWSYDGDLSAHSPAQFRFGAITGAVAESWQVDFDDLRVHSYYPNHGFQVEGFPFADIGPVYEDNVYQPASQTIGSYTQTVTKYPEYGMVVFGGTYPDFREPGEVMVRVINDAGGKHALTIITELLEAAGVSDYIDADALAAAYLAVPDDIINARFEGGGTEKRGLRDVASLGMTIAEALVEICSRCLYWLFVDHGAIKIIPYTGTPPASPVLALTDSNLREAAQTIDLSEINDAVSAIYGWYERNNSLYYLAGTQTAGGQETTLDFSWDSPVVSESLDMVKSKVDLLYKFLSARETIDPARLNLAGARLELMDPVSVRDDVINDVLKNYWVTRKEVGFDSGARETVLQLTRYLGET